MDPVREWIEEEYCDSELLFADGFDEAIIGVSEHWAPTSKGGATQSTAVAYDWDKCMEILVEEGLSWDEAAEHMSINVVGGYHGEHTPVFIRQPKFDPGTDVLMRGERKETRV
jgi:hypothetical protein